MFSIILILPVIPYIIYHWGFLKNSEDNKKTSFFSALEFLLIVFMLCHLIILVMGKNTNNFSVLGHFGGYFGIYTIEYILLEIIIAGVLIFIDIETQKHSENRFVSRLKVLSLPVKSILLGITIFCAIYGVKVLNPTYTDWLMSGGDLSQHYLGWCFFRTSDWQFPIGLYNGLSYPSSCSIIYTDSIPAFAVIFKLLSPILPSGFQYFGLWGIMCFALQCLLGSVICKKYTDKDYCALLGGALITLTPVMIWRMFGHETLAGQWIILLSWLPLIYPEKFKSIKRTILFWMGMGILCGCTHLYFVPMCGIALVAYIVKEFVERRDIKSVIGVGSFVISGLCTIYILGGFASGAGFEGGGFGKYNSNLNALINSQGHSLFLNDLGFYGGGQYEGFGYLGAGVIVLLMIAMVLFLQLAASNCDEAKKYIRGSVPFSVIFIISFCLAVIPNIALGYKLIFTIEFPEFIVKLLSIFRANGRFIWNCVYVIAIVSLIANMRLLNKKILPYILLACLFIQIGDLSLWFSSIYRSYSNEKTYDSLLKDDKWSEIADEGFEHVYISQLIDSDEKKRYSIAKWADENDMTLNRFYFAREVEGIPENYEIAINDPQSIDLFIFSNGDYYDYIKMDNLYSVDDFIIGTSVDMDMEKINPSGLTLIPEDLSCNNNTEKYENNSFIIHPGGTIFGPYITLHPGRYKIIYEGEGLDKCTFDCVCEHGELHIDLGNIFIDANCITYEITLNEITENIEFRLFNNAEKDAVLYQIKVESNE